MDIASVVRGLVAGVAVSAELAVPAYDATAAARMTKICVQHRNINERFPEPPPEDFER